MLLHGLLMRVFFFRRSLITFFSFITMNKSRIVLLPLILLSVILIIYGRATQYSFVPYDDPAYITENSIVNEGLSVRGVRWAFLYDSKVGELKYTGVENLWHPLTWVSHMIDVEVFGAENPGGHHVTNILLFLATAILVMWSSEMILGSFWAGFLFALLWAIHPLKIESVAWISERKDILSGVFFWASLAFSIKWIKNKGRWKTLAYVLFICGMLSKPSILVLPALIVLVDGYLEGEKTWGIRYFLGSLRRWWLWFLSSSFFAVITIVMQSGGSHEFFAQQSSLVSRLLPSGLSLWFYFWRILVPINLSFEYEYPQLSLRYYYLAWLAVLTLFAFVWLKREKMKTLFFGIAWFLVCWLPVSGLVYVGASFTTDRYMYLALAGLLFPLVSAVHRFKFGNVVILMLCCIWAVLSWKQVPVWKDGWSLFKHATEARPHSARAWINLGGMHQDAKELDEAVECYQKAIEIDDKSYLAWYNIGNIKDRSGDLEAAESAYQKTLEIYHSSLPAMLNLGILKKKTGQLEEAIALFEKGSSKDIRMLSLQCESELMLGNMEKGEALLRRLENTRVNHPVILERIEKMRGFIDSRN